MRQTPESPDMHGLRIRILQIFKITNFHKLESDTKF